ncbi:diamine N-acetyltransferase [Pelagirhabdus alkalitolerans]|uniref:Diamine N-acetyltransferase n=1 Tax=Pelagirhabdus alkalitolerans TaxID=1612202 RepID=A0A1G6GNG6_9BACI|nr:GNAT family N-acetyltransferase [Pelagirhabdus alkalitolerans]SDB83489.1 diamine N-acetyltransferase [Pelagirhabdus alkalitolerans]
MEDKLHIRPLEKDDLEFIYKMRTNPEVMDYWCEEPYTTKEKLTKEYEEHINSRSHRAFILYHANDKVGFLALYGIDSRHRNAEFAIMFDPAQHGKGYAKKATRIMVDYAFNQLNLNKLSLEVVKQNEKAIHIYESVGFKVEGDLKQHYFVDGEYCDGLMMGLLREDYLKQSH